MTTGNEPVGGGALLVTFSLRFRPKVYRLEHGLHLKVNFWDICSSFRLSRLTRRGWGIKAHGGVSHGRLEKFLLVFKALIYRHIQELIIARGLWNAGGRGYRAPREPHIWGDAAASAGESCPPPPALAPELQQRPCLRAEPPGVKESSPFTPSLPVGPRERAPRHGCHLWPQLLNEDIQGLVSGPCSR